MCDIREMQLQMLVPFKDTDHFVVYGAELVWNLWKITIRTCICLPKYISPVL